MARRSRIEEMPPDARRWLERALMENNFREYEELAALARAKGYVISKSALGRYGQKMERRFAAIKASTEAARMLTEGAADDQDARSEAVIALVQTELFESIVNLQEAGEEGMSDADCIGLLSKAAKNIATLARASVALKKFQQEVRERVKTAADTVTAMAKKGGLTPDAVEAIRNKILGIGAAR
jgi:hypothetical protein